MKARIFYVLLFLILMVCLPISTTFGQTYEQERKQILEKQTHTRAEINVLNARINNYEKRIDLTEKKYDELYKQYENVNQLLSLQNNKLKSLSREQSQIQEEINMTKEEIKVREEELKILIENYKKILLYAYKNGRTTNLELLLTSSSINQMLVRSFYLQKFEDQKIKQANLIKSQKIELDNIRQDLEESLKKNEVILREINHEKSRLNQQKTIQKQSVDVISKESKKLADELRKTRLQKQNLENMFASLINEETRIREAEKERLAKLAEAEKIADSERRAREVAKYSKPIARENYVSDEILLTFEQKFVASKSNLPWPVNSTTVSKKFGITRNPLYGTKTEHPGINIVADAASEVHVVSDGYVFAIRPTPGYGDVVYVKHGNYFTAYGNLSKVLVPNLTNLKAGDVIGLSGTNDSELGETVFFMVRKNATNLDPEEWLK